MKRLVSKFAFQWVNLYRYTVDTDGGPEAEAEDQRRVDEIVQAWAKTPVGLHKLNAVDPIA